MNKDNIFLTVGIPTFNREQSLHGLLVEISKMDMPICPCEILIINNGDPYDINPVLLKNLGEKYRISILINKENCGGQENVLRIYENSAGEYVWFLGDDDRVSANAINEVIQILEKERVDVLHFNSDAKDHPLSTKMSERITFFELISGNFPLRRLMFAPLFVIRRSAVIPSLPRVRLYLGCFAPQLALMLLSEPNSVYFLNKIIVNCDIVPVTRSQRLSILPVFIGIGNIKRVTDNKELRNAIIKLLKNEWRFYLSPNKIIGALAMERISGRRFSIGKYIEASYRAHPLWLTIFMLPCIFGIRFLPKKLFELLIGFLYRTIRGNDMNFSDFYSEERI